MTRSGIWIGIGALALAMMGTVSTDPSNGDVALSSLSIGGAPALARDRGDRRGGGRHREHRGGPAIPDILETLDDLGVLDDADDDGPDDGPDDDDDDDDAPAKTKKKTKKRS